MWQRCTGQDRRWHNFADDAQTLLAELMGRMTQTSTAVGEVVFDMSGGPEWVYKITLCLDRAHEYLTGSPEGSVGFQRKGLEGDGTQRWVRYVDPSVLPDQEGRAQSPRAHAT